MAARAAGLAAAVWGRGFGQALVLQGRTGRWSWARRWRLKASPWTRAQLSPFSSSAFRASSSPTSSPHLLTRGLDWRRRRRRKSVPVTETQGTGGKGLGVEGGSEVVETPLGLVEEEEDEAGRGGGGGGEGGEEGEEDVAAGPHAVHEEAAGDVGEEPEGERALPALLPLSTRLHQKNRIQLAVHQSCKSA